MELSGGGGKREDYQLGFENKQVTLPGTLVGICHHPLHLLAAAAGRPACMYWGWGEVLCGTAHLEIWKLLQMCVSCLSSLLLLLLLPLSWSPGPPLDWTEVPRLRIQSHHPSSSLAGSTHADGALAD